MIPRDFLAVEDLRKAYPGLDPARLSYRKCMALLQRSLAAVAGRTAALSPPAYLEDRIHELAAELRKRDPRHA